MKITTTPLRIALLAAGLPFSIGTVFAAANDVDEVVVTATKREELLKDVAMSITAPALKLLAGLLRCQAELAQ